MAWNSVDALFSVSSLRSDSQRVRKMEEKEMAEAEDRAASARTPSSSVFHIPSPQRPGDAGDYAGDGTGDNLAKYVEPPTPEESSGGRCGG